MKCGLAICLPFLYSSIRKARVKRFETRVGGAPWEIAVPPVCERGRRIIFSLKPPPLC